MVSPRIILTALAASLGANAYVYPKSSAQLIADPSASHRDVPPPSSVLLLVILDRVFNSLAPSVSSRQATTHLNTPSANSPGSRVNHLTSRLLSQLAVRRRYSYLRKWNPHIGSDDARIGMCVGSGSRRSRWGGSDGIGYNFEELSSSPICCL